MTSGDPVSSGESGSRRRPRAEARRSESVWVRLSPDEAAVVGEAAVRAGMSVGAWVGETAVGRARGDGRGEVGGSEPSSWRELVAALVALRIEVAAVRREPAVGLVPDVPPRELLDGQTSDDSPGDVDAGGVVGLLRRIDAVTAAASNAASTEGRRSLPAGGERSGRS
jgi:hypothetical protein